MLYGNITDTSQILFQFDKIYPSRHAMDENIFNDVIAPNHFVVVSYGYNPQLNDTTTSEDTANGYAVVSSDDFIGGYHNEEDQTATDSGDTTRIMYVDSYCTYPFEYTDYTLVDQPESTQISKYYIERNGFYFKAPSWVQGETYYLPTNTNGNSSRFVTAGQIIRRRFNDNGYDVIKNPYPNGYSKEFFICTSTPQSMVNPDTNSNIGTISAAIFKPLTSVMGTSLITENQNLSTYLTNHLIDATHYANLDDAFGSLNKGYDGTIWQRVIGEGTEYYVCIAHLNAETQAIVLVAEPPTVEPEAPFMGADSTSKVATLHMPSQWGFRIKPDENGDVSVVPADGDEAYTGAIYYNKDGFDVEASKKDTSTANTVAITADGRSSDYATKYAFSRRGADGHDILQLSASLPAIGNMVAEGYDLMYGDGSEAGNENHIRHRDTTWYDAYSELRDSGDNSIGGKTFDPSTLAGTINTYHNRLGQIIHNIEEIPSAAEIEVNWQDDIIYYNTTDHKYYRKGTNYIRHGVTYSYQECTAEAAANYMPNTYLLDTNDGGFASNDVGYFANCTITNQSNAVKNLYGDTFGSYQSGKTYYKRVLDNTTAGYIPVTLIPYESDRYYYSEGNDYYKDVGQEPKYPERNYVEITTSGDYTFAYNYELNTYYTSNTEGTEFTLSSAAFDPHKTYWSLVISPNMNSTTHIPYQPYQPNIYYYKDNGVYKKATSADPVNGTDYYYLELEPVPTGILVNGEEVIGYRILESIQVYFPRTQDLDHTIPLYYLDASTNTYKQITQEWLAAQGRDYFAEPENNPTYKFTTKIDITDLIYEADKYYLSETLDNGSQHIFLASSNDYNNTNHYFDITVSAPQPKFYYPNMYWFKANAAGSTYVEATTPAMQTNGRYYIKSDVYVIADAKHKCPYGYIWNLEATCVPWPFELATFDVSTSGAVEIANIDNGLGSLHGKILELARFLNLQDGLTRDGTSVKGALNLLEDKCYTLGNLTPNYLAYANGIGQLTSSNIPHSDIVTMRNTYNKPNQIKMTGYVAGNSTANIATTDTLLAAMAKLENRIAALENA